MTEATPTGTGREHTSQRAWSVAGRMGSTQPSPGPSHAWSTQDRKRAAQPDGMGSTRPSPDRAETPLIMPWTGLIAAVLGLRLLVSLIGVGIVLLLPQPHQSYRLDALLLAPWRHFDALWFTRIAAQGYGSSPLATAYMPLYPLLIRAASLFTGGHYLIAALIVSNLSLVAAVGLLWRWVAELFNARIAWRTIALLLLFPDSFFLVGAYSESLFLALSAGCLLALRRERRLLAGTLALLATLTRLQGLVLIVPMLLALRPCPAPASALCRRPAGVPACRAAGAHWCCCPWFPDPPGTPVRKAARRAMGRRNRDAVPVRSLLIGVAGAVLPLLGFTLYQRVLTIFLRGGDVFSTYRTQWHIPLQTPWQTIWEYVTVIRSPQWNLIHSSRYNYILLWYLLIALISLGMLLISWRRLGWELTFFGLAGWCFLMTRWYSTGRYMLSVLPFFIAMAIWADGPRRFRWLTIAGLLLLVFFTAQFVQNSWVD